VRFDLCAGATAELRAMAKVVEAVQIVELILGRWVAFTLQCSRLLFCVLLKLNLDALNSAGTVVL